MIRQAYPAKFRRAEGPKDLPRERQSEKEGRTGRDE